MFSFLFHAVLCGAFSMAEEPLHANIPVDGIVQAAEAPLNVEILVIHATTDHNEKDERIQPLLKYFANYKYTGYKLLDEQTTKLSDKQKQTFSLPSDLKMMVEILSHNETQAKVLVKITGQKDDHKYLESTITVPRNSNFMVAGPKHDNGILIFPLSVKY